MNQKLATSEKYSLTIKEAADYFGIGIKRMRRLAEDHLGTFSAYNGNRYLIIRAEFEAYLKKTPIMPGTKGEELKRAQLEDKSIFNPEEAIVFYATTSAAGSSRSCLRVKRSFPSWHSSKRGRSSSAMSLRSTWRITRRLWRN